MPSQIYRVRGPLDLRRTLAPLSHGSSDHTIRFGPGRAWRATRTADGPATVVLVHAGDEVRAEAFGPGADRALAAVPALLDLDADAGRSRPATRSSHTWPSASRASGSRGPARSLESLVPAILEQKVTGQEAHRALAG